MAWTTPGTATAGEVLTAAFWNTQVRDNMVELAPFSAAWTSFTPQLRTASTNRTSTVVYARYMKVGKIVWAQALVTASATGGANEIVKLSLPSGFTPTSITFVTADLPVGEFMIKDTGTAYYVGAAVVIEATGGLHYLSGNAYGTQNQMGAATPAMTIAIGDTVGYSVMYEIN